MNSNATAVSAGRLAALAGEEFERRFGRCASAVAAAPGRVNLIGDHTDYNEGFALPMAIDRGVVVAAAPGGASRSRVCSLALGAEAEFDIHGPVDAGWGAYAHGVAIELSKLGGKSAPFDAVVASDVPLGAGLSSSAALEVACSLALETMWGVMLEPLERAMLCARAEREHAGAPCGLMDQLVACRAEAGGAMLIDFRSNESAPIPLDEGEISVVVAHSGVTHALGDGVYARRRAECEQAAAIAGVRSLRDLVRVDRARSGDSGDEAAMRRALHVVSENERTLLGAEALRAGAYKQFGRLMTASHASMRDDFEASCPEVDALVDEALKIEGVFGARMTGGGFGGCIVALTRADAAEGCVERLRTRTSATGESCFIVRSSGRAQTLLSESGA